MEFIHSVRVSALSAEPIPNRRESYTAWARTGGAWASLAVLAALAVFLVALWPVATALAFAAGAIVRVIGHRLRWKAVLDGDAGRSFARFRVINGNLECTFHEDLVNRYGRSLAWRVAAAFAAGTVCLAAQHFHWLPWNLLHLTELPPWLARTGDLCSPLLPLAFSVLFLLARGPQTYWPEALKTAIRSQADEVLTAIMRPGEIDGVEAGVAGLYRQLDLWWAGEYRASILRWIEAHTEQAIFEPQAAADFIKDITKVARTDLNHLAEAAESFRAVECRHYALEALMRATGEARPEFAQQAARSTDELRNLAITKSWEQLTVRAAEIKGELDDSILEFRLRSQMVVTLPSGTDPYRVLGTESSASTATIKQLRLRLAQVYHPDIGGDTSNGTKMAELNAAYDEVMRERATLAK